MKILFFGIGGVGGTFGGAIARVHRDTYFYARRATKEAIQQKGLILESKKLGLHTIHPKLVSDNPQELGKMDVIFVATKGNKLTEVCQSLSPLIQKSTVVIPLLNGIMTSNLLRPHLPSCILCDGIVRTFSHIHQPGHIIEDGGFLSMILGQQGGNNPPLLYDLANIVTDAGIDVSVSEQIELESWKKLAVTGTMSAIFCYYQGNAGYCNAQKDSQQIIPAAYRELQAVAAANGISLPQDFINRLIQSFYKYPPKTVSSLYRDLAAGKSSQDTELDLMIGYVVQEGKKQGIPTPIFEVAYKNYAK